MSLLVASPEPIVVVDEPIVVVDEPIVVVDETVVVSVACVHDFLLPLLFMAAMATSLLLCRVSRPVPKE